MDETSTFRINDLPLETLAEVFLSLQREVRGPPLWLHFNPRVLRHFTPIELTLSSVCRRWRDFSLRTPQLWTHIQFHAPIESVQAYLTRSRGCVLDLIHVYLANPLDRLILAISHSIRWNSLSVIAPDEATLDSIIDLLRDVAVPSLQYLNISFPDLNKINPTRDYLIFRLSPTLPLRHLALQRLNPTRLNLPLHLISTFFLELDTIDADVLTETELRRVLAEMPALETLGFRGLPATLLEPPQSAHPIDMGSLRSLSFSLYYSRRNALINEFALKTSQMISAPKLHTLRLLNFSDQVTAKYLREHLHQRATQPSPYPQLRVFDFRSHLPTFPQTTLFLEFLRETPSIEHLILPSQLLPRISQLILRDAALRDAMPFLPSWRTLSVHCYKHEKLKFAMEPYQPSCLDVPAVIELVRTRNEVEEGSDERITTVRCLTGCASTFPDLRELKNLGVDFQVIPKGEWTLWSDTL